MQKNNLEKPQNSKAMKKIKEIANRMASDHPPEREELDGYIQLVVDNPETWQCVSQAGETVQHDIVRKLGGSESAQAVLVAHIEVLKKELGYDNASALERITIEHICTTRLRLMLAEHIYNNNMLRDRVDKGEALFHEKLLSGAHRRYRQATESLARIRKLSQNIPNFQINVAKDGGQQFNVNTG